MNTYTVTCGFCDKNPVKIPEDLYDALAAGEPIDCAIMCDPCERK